MTAGLKIVTVVGARPQFVKAAPVGAAFRARGIEEVLVHTGQHFDRAMSDVFFEELEIAEPAYHLGINSLSHGAMTGRMIEAIETVLTTEKPDALLVYGDTNSTLAGALAAAKLHIPVVHVEAGLRSFDRRMPEEVNRVLADHLSALLFSPTAAAVANLEREGIRDGVHAVGDVMYDATLLALQKARGHSDVLTRLGLEPGRYAVATVHRAENTDDADRFRSILAWLELRAREGLVAMPVHPRTRAVMRDLDLAPDGVRLVEPLGYLDMIWLVHHAAAVFTDSGGLQKEAYFHGVPCVTLRDVTEWVETIEHGWNRLWTEEGYRERSPITDYGDGRSAEAIARLVGERFGGGLRS